VGWRRPMHLSAGSKLLVVLLIVAGGSGFFVINHTIDLFRQRQEVAVREMRDIRLELSRIQRTLKEISSGGTYRDDLRVSSQSQSPRFANLQVRELAAEEGGHLVLATMLEMQNMNYLASGGWDVRDYWRWTFDTLAERNLKEPERFEPMLARCWERSDDGLIYTIELRSGVLWHDFTDPTTGERFENIEVTAEDFRFFIDVIRMPEVPAEDLRLQYRELERIEVIDRYHFKVHWRQPMYLSEQFTLELQPLPRHFYRFDDPRQFRENAERNRMIVGCGPWMLESWQKGKTIIFRRNEAYYGPRPHLRKIRVKVIRELNAVLLALENGAIDMASVEGVRWLQKAEDEEFKQRFHMVRYPVAAVWTLNYNQHNDLFADRRIRVALAHLTDRARILNDVYNGLGRLVWNPFLANSPYADDSITPYPFDIEAARQLLTDTGWHDTDGDGILDRDGRKFEFNFMTLPASNISQAKVAAMLREDCAKVGIIVHIHSLEWSVFQNRIQTRSFDACMGGFRAGSMRSEWEVDPFAHYHSSAADAEGTQNITGFKNREADRLLEEARREFDRDKRIMLYREFCQLAHKQQPRTIMLTPDHLFVIDRRFRNVKAYPLGLHINSFWVPQDEQKYRE